MSLLHILTYNIQFGRKLNSILGWFAELDTLPDIFSFQEFPMEALEIFNKTPYGKCYKSAFAPSLVLGSSIYGEATFYRADLRILHKLTIELGMSEFEKKLFRISGQRSALITSFQFGSKAINIANIHIIWFSLHGTRLEHLTRIMTHLELKQPNLIVGDYNYTNIFGINSLINHMNLAGFELAGENLITHKIFGLIQHQLDYAFFRNCHVSEIRTCNKNYSDHYPVFLKLTV